MNKVRRSHYAEPSIKVSPDVTVPGLRFHRRKPKILEAPPMPRPQRDPDPDSLIGHFGAELRTYRARADLSMNRLGEALGCSGQWIGQVELAEKPPSEQFAIDLDTYFESGGGFHRLWQSIKRASRRRVPLPGFPRYLELEAEACSSAPSRHNSSPACSRRRRIPEA
jgi:transcriptional regulator with XRE-family HTH domain